MGFLKFVTVEEMRGKRPRLVSRWFTADCMMSLGFCICNFLTTMLCSWMTSCIGAAFVLFLILYFGKRLYRLDTPTPKVLHTIAVMLRCILYPAAILLTILPYTLRNDWTWYYPIQRAAYTGGRAEIVDTLMPEKLPETVRGYDISLTPAGMDLLYYTDGGTIAAYREYALACGAEGMDITDESAAKWRNILEEDGAEPAGTEVWIFAHATEHTAVYLLNETTGYFRAYW